MEAVVPPVPLSADAARATECAMMAEASSGSTSALAGVYDLTSAKVLGLVLGVLGDRSSAEHVLQEAYLDVWRRAHEFGGEKVSVTAWVCGIAHRLAVEHLRAAGSSGAAVSTDETDCVALAYYSGLSQAEIAARTGQTLDVVRTRTRVGLSQLSNSASAPRAPLTA
ncbi:sigma factor [Microbacterium maritypicum]